MQIEKESTTTDTEAIRKRFQSVRQRTVEICAPLTIEDHIPQPLVFASPPKWHLAHTTWFFEEMVLKQFATNYSVHHPHYGYYFNSYYNLIGNRTNRADRGSITRPGVNEVYEYRKVIDEAVLQLLASDQITREAIDLIELGTHHEQQHQELLITDIKALFSQNPFHPVYKSGYDLAGGIQEEAQKWIEIPEGLYQVGAEKTQAFTYDNERDRHRVYLHPVKLSNKLVSVGEYREFMNDEGYKRPELWLDDGWKWLQETGIDRPMYWQDESMHRYSLGGLQPLIEDEILTHISYYEADAYARWKNMRLPTEAEWEVAADRLKWGARWEWTSSAYAPYPGFNTTDGPVGEYNGKFMVNQMIMRGASLATAKDHSRKTYRNFFHPELQWQYSGIRLAQEQ